MNDLWRIILSTIGGIGGIGAVIVVIVKLCSNIIANNLKKKYELELNERFEKYKANVESKKYITKVRFDAEFRIYGELSEAFFEMVKNINALVPVGLANVPADKEQKEKKELEDYNDAKKAIVKAQDVLNYNASFIPEKFFNQYDEIRRLCVFQLDDFGERWNLSFPGTKEEKSHLSHETYERTREINEKNRQLSKEIREYLETLDVIV